MSSVEQELVAAAREVAALFVEHPFVPRTWVEVHRFVAAVEAQAAAAPDQAALDDDDDGGRTPAPASPPPAR